MICNSLVVGIEPSCSFRFVCDSLLMTTSPRKLGTIQKSLEKLTETVVVNSTLRSVEERSSGETTTDASSGSEMAHARKSLAASTTWLWDLVVARVAVREPARAASVIACLIIRARPNSIRPITNSTKIGVNTAISTTVARNRR